MSEIYKFGSRHFTEDYLKECTFITTRECNCNDFKTVSAKDIAPIPPNSKVKYIRVLKNCYGTFFVVEYNGHQYNLKIEDLEIINDKNYYR